MQCLLNGQNCFVPNTMYVADNKFQLSFISSWYTHAEVQEDISDRVAEVEGELTCEEFGGADPTDADENLRIVWHKIVEIYFCKPCYYI